MARTKIFLTQVSGSLTGSVAEAFAFKQAANSYLNFNTSTAKVEVGQHTLVASGKEIQFADTGEKISGDGSDLSIASGGKINLTATSDVHIPKNIGLVFDDNASEKIESNNTDLFINSGADIMLSASSDVNIPYAIGLTLGADSNKIEAATNNNVEINAGAALTLDGVTGITLQENNADILTIDNDRDVDYSTNVRNYVLTGSGTAHLNAGGAINIGNVSSNSAINIGTAGARTVTIGNSEADVVIVADNNTTTFTGNVVINDSLTVRGATTTLTSSNTVIQDGIIGLGTSGSEGYGPASLDRGIIFGGGAIGAAQPGFFYDGSASKFVVATTKTSPTSASFGTATTSELDTLVAVAVHLGAMDGNEAITGDGDDITFTAGQDVVFNQTGDVVINSTKKLEFGGAGSGEHILHGGSNILELVAGADILLNPAGDVVVDGTSRLEFNAAGSGEHISGDGNSLTVASGQDLLVDATRNISLDADNLGTVSLKDNGTEYARFEKSSNKAVLVSAHTVTDAGHLILSASNSGSMVQVFIDGESGSAERVSIGYNKQASHNFIRFDGGKNAVIESGNEKVLTLAAKLKGYIELGLNDAQSSNLAYLQLSGSGANSTINVGGANGKFESEAGQLTISGSALILDNGVSGTEAQLKFKSDNANHVTVTAPGSLGAAYTLTLPANDGDSGQFLQSDGNGVLSFADVASPTQKKSKTISARVNAGVAEAIAADGGGFLQASWAGAGEKNRELYLNGQLLLEGATNDFVRDGNNVKFNFNLEKDDLLTFIYRA